MRWPRVRKDKNALQIKKNWLVQLLWKRLSLIMTYPVLAQMTRRPWSMPSGRIWRPNENDARQWCDDLRSSSSSLWEKTNFPRSCRPDLTCQAGSRRRRGTGSPGICLYSRRTPAKTIRTRFQFPFLTTPKPLWNPFLQSTCLVLCDCRNFALFCHHYGLNPMLSLVKSCLGMELSSKRGHWLATNIFSFNNELDHFEK